MPRRNPVSFQMLRSTDSWDGGYRSHVTISVPVSALSLMIEIREAQRALHFTVVANLRGCNSKKTLSVIAFYTRLFSLLASLHV